MDGRPPEVIDTANGEYLKLACMACIRGHRTKHCGGHNCRDKILWTIKRPGRPSNSCMCKFSGTGRCKCVLAKAQCPHKPKKGEKKTVDCRCDERGRLCCTLSASQWDMIAQGQKPGVKLYRTSEELVAAHSERGFPPPTSRTNDFIPQAQSPMSAPRTPAASIGGFTNGSGGSTPQTPMSVLHHPVGILQTPSVPQSPGGMAGTRFGMMGLGAPMGSEGHFGQDVLSWQGQTPIAPASRPAFSTPPAYSQPPAQIHSAFSTATDTSFAAPPYTFDSAISQPPSFSPVQQPVHLHSHPQTPLYQPPPSHIPTQHTFDTLPPVVTESFSDLSMAPNGTLPAVTGFDIDYFNFQFPGAICQHCGMADCTCVSCPTVMQNTMDGSWRQCCSRKHVHFGSAAASTPGEQAGQKSCCSSKGNAGTPANGTTVHQLAHATTPATNMAYTNGSRNAGGCCAGSNSQPADFNADPFDFNTQSNSHQYHHDPFHATSPPQEQAATTPHIPAFITHEPDGVLFDPGAPLPHTHPPDQTNHQPFISRADPIPELDFKVDPVPAWQNPEDMDMDFDEFLQEMGDGEGGCGCGANCPCGMDEDPDDGAEMDVDDAAESPSTAGEGGTPKKGGCCGGG